MLYFFFPKGCPKLCLDLIPTNCDLKTSILINMVATNNYYGHLELNSGQMGYSTSSPWASTTMPQPLLQEDM